MILHKNTILSRNKVFNWIPRHSTLFHLLDTNQTTRWIDYKKLG